MPSWTLPIALLLVGCETAGEPLPAPSDSEDSATDTTLPLCEDPEPILERGGLPSGYQRCTDGAINRGQPEPLDLTHYAEQVRECPGASPKIGGDCTEDADCGREPNGQCASWWNGFDQNCYCQYLCSSDLDCEPGTICVSPKASSYDWPVCVPATCTQDADCPSGECGLGTARDMDTIYAELSCRSEADTCHGDDGCGVSSGGQYCLPEGEDGAFRCEDYTIWD